ncbi:hypothetical protein D3C75_701420 [compost metagenome]
MLMEGWQAGQAAGHDARAVITAIAGDDFLLLRAPEHVVVVANQFDLGFVGVGTGEAVVDLLHAFRRPVDNAARQFDDRFGRMPHVGVVIGQFLGLLVDGVGDFGATIADVHAVQAGEGVDEFAAFVVANADARCALDDAPLECPAGVIMGVGRRVHEMRTVLLEQGVEFLAHGRSPQNWP